VRRPVAHGTFSRTESADERIRAAPTSAGRAGNLVFRAMNHPKIFVALRLTPPECSAHSGRRPRKVGSNDEHLADQPGIH
jgi:hypothetical protein